MLILLLKKHYNHNITLISEKNRHGSDGGEASIFVEGVISILVERLTRRGKYLRGLLSSSLLTKIKGIWKKNKIFSLNQ